MCSVWLGFALLRLSLFISFYEYIFGSCCADNECILSCLLLKDSASFAKSHEIRIHNVTFCYFSSFTCTCGTLATPGLHLHRTWQILSANKSDARIENAPETRNESGNLFPNSSKAASDCLAFASTISSHFAQDFPSDDWSPSRPIWSVRNQKNRENTLNKRCDDWSNSSRSECSRRHWCKTTEKIAGKPFSVILFGNGEKED